MLPHALSRLVLGHGALITPPPRNAIDHTVAPWNGPVPQRELAHHWCPVPDASAPLQKNLGRVSGKNGQACFWFNAGCSIGCDTCDGVTRGPIPNIPCTKPLHENEECKRKMSVCEKGKGLLPLLPTEARTVNTDVEDGAEDDWYQYSPWRRPGSSGITDPCGVAGGRLRDVPADGKYGISYQNTTLSQGGERGSLLPRRTDVGTVWTAGDVVEVSWSLTANHGGGYYYRLCKPSKGGLQLTEDCFQLTPLAFVGKTRLRWDGDPATEEEIENVFVDVGTHPAGSKWAMNPIPRNDTALTGASFAPRCNETCTGCGTPGDKGEDCLSCRCTGMWGAPNLEIVDHVALPWMLPPGDYVLGWRWDTEESNQVWGSCADVTIRAHPVKAGAGAAGGGKAPGASASGSASGPSAAAKSSFGKVPCPLPHAADCLAGWVEEATGTVNSRWSSSRWGSPLPFNETLDYVQQLLQQAVEVEHSTIPLYLSALFSINAGESQYALAAIHSVVTEEMLHMTIAANVLNAIGGSPSVDKPSFIPTFPLPLPLTNVSVNLKALSDGLIQKFMLIESTTRRSKSIGAAYEYILSLLDALCEQYGEKAVFHGNPFLQVDAMGWAPKINTLADAISGLLGIAEQGGGCPVPGKEELWPQVSNISNGPLTSSSTAPLLLSHWARFAEINAGKQFLASDSVEGGPHGAAVDTNWSAVRMFKANPRVEDYPANSNARTLAHYFAANYTSILVMLHNVFNGAPQNYAATLGVMHQISVNAATVLATPDPLRPGFGVGPTWQYVSSESQYAARGGKARPIVEA